MKIYLVGGAVRDKLLGLSPKERDYVVVEATATEMLQLGYRQVGKDFPVFLHPETHEEYALARKERKLKPGYTGFEFETSASVTLEEDLKRRDLTLNAMAETLDGKLIDPYHGQTDLKRKILRHVSEAFSEDPVRILRVGRFLARFSHLGFRIAPETISLMQKMSKAGEINALVPERVWKELEKALNEKTPSAFFKALDEAHALSILFPTLPVNDPGLLALEAAAAKTENPVVRLAALLYNQDRPAVSLLASKYRFPNPYRDLAKLTVQHYQTILNYQTASSDTLLNLFYAIDIFRRPKRLHDLLETCQAIADSLARPFDPGCLLEMAKAAQSVNVQALLAQGLDKLDLAKALKKERQIKIQDKINFFAL